MEKQLWNEGWRFTKEAVEIPKTISEVTKDFTELNLPHTWNGIDGQDGGNDYYRGACYYTKSLPKSVLKSGSVFYLEFEGVNSSADVYINGNHLTRHDGGYSTFRVNLTEYIEDENLIVVKVDNSPNDYVYPQMADFTFYGGIYRNVSLICVEDAHFDLDTFGSSAIKVTPDVKGSNCDVSVEVYVDNATEENTLTYSILSGGKVILEKMVSASETRVNFEIENVHLWNGIKDPFLYTAKVELKSNDKVIDKRVTRFGCRTFEIHPEKGFILNGKEYPLRGVSRHQDWPKIGNALKKEHHDKDMELICELGATTIRLAHYQHDQYFYDLCDEKGLVIWAEIPYISKHMPKGFDNTISQMNELVHQNYNHPSIFVWGLSNEISIGGESNQSLIDNHYALNDLCHALDKTRPTTIAAVSMCDIDCEYIHISDVLSYNHYFGWYGGETEHNGPWFDNFHTLYPNKAIGCSEYGCEALDWHSSTPEQGDYTEEYQAHYHEELIKQFFSRPYMWSTHVWNMFDFAADARDEGGLKGMNNKGLVRFDREYKKDSFYAYKAWLSDEKFIHLCSKKYIDRVEDVTKVKVYSNLEEIELYLNGELFAKKKNENNFFHFDIPNIGETTITAKYQDFSDESKIKKVDEANEDYILKEEGDIINWFDIEMPDGYFNINDKISQIMTTSDGQKLIMSLVEKMMPKDEGSALGNKSSESMMKMLSGFTVKRFYKLLGAMFTNDNTSEKLLEINKVLNTIKRPDSNN